MKRFIIKLTLFFAPFVIVLAGAEMRLRKAPNSYSAKLALLKENRGCEVLILGPSYALRGLDPNFFGRKGFNLGNVRQSLYHDSRLLQRLAPTLPDLKVVVFTVAYFSLEYDPRIGPERWRSFFYRQYYGIPPNGWRLWLDVRNYSRVALYGGDEIRSQILRLVAPLLPASAGGWFGATDAPKDLLLPDMSANGWLPCDDVLQDIGAQKGRARVEFHHHNLMRERFRQENIRYLREGIEFALQRGVTPILVTVPVFHTYSDHVDRGRYLWMQESVEHLRAEYKIRYLNYFTDHRFEREDFGDPDHLNSKGAAKFSRIFSEEALQTSVK